MSAIAPSSASTIAATALETGQRVQFAETGDLWWTVRAVSNDHHFVILTTPIPEEDNNNEFPDDTENSVYYTIIDNERRVRGPDNVWGNGYDTDAQIARSLQNLLDEEIEVSRRPSNWENIRIVAVLPLAPPMPVDPEEGCMPETHITSNDNGRP
ncbi:hypothetical protein HG717_01340 [Rhodococcus erythropolis]|uniref:hypothetical protein n=1 Tax=Rhodococcus TaxID=1827 RepID=UPI001AE6967C|nr:MULTISPECIES: hypothetical protein [Rhodococcus]MBP2520961.1 hypothetical protein [Rhodococcus sp. PvP104]MBY6382556.1 hypothetical protein [Rhodococcus erythropolis]